mmetsp:Transcript_23741/g.44344  ORF Transcript_23741/g.44344 Transcript_23741/m.44344 type:complete len:197 (-) Transcript_23741:73-663(-)
MEDVVKKMKRARKAWKEDAEDSAMKKRYTKHKKAKKRLEARDRSICSMAKDIESKRKVIQAKLKFERARNVAVLTDQNQFVQDYIRTYYNRIRVANKKQKAVQKAVKKAGKAINTLFVVGFPRTASKEQVEKVFASQVGFEAMSYNQKEGKSPIVFARFASVEAASKCLADLQGLSFEGQKLRLAYAKYELQASRR